MTEQQKVIRAKVGILELAKQLGNVSQACRAMGYSRDSSSAAAGGARSPATPLAALVVQLLEAIEARVDPQDRGRRHYLALELPAYGQVRIANEVRKRHALAVSPPRGCAASGCATIWKP